ncbi:LicD family protein [Bacillus sp. BGMRC 2118]|nr:LicD family protein [Bacillus sp. BGMRC 2118]
MSTGYEKFKSYIIGKSFYKKLKENPLLLKVNQHLKNRVEAAKRESVHKFGLESICIIRETFNEVDKKFWLDYGTLLGAIRDKDFIGHDADVDLGTLFTSNEDIRKIEQLLIGKGMKKSREFQVGNIVVEQTYIHKGVNVDIYYYHREEENKISCFACEEGKQTVYKKMSDHMNVTGLTVRKITHPQTGLKEITFKGELFNIPENHHEYLVNNYGPTYMVKDANWDWTTIDNNVILPFEDNTEASIYF